MRFADLGLLQSLIRAVKIWRTGARRLSERAVKELLDIEHRGVLLEAIPSIADKPDLKAVENALVSVWHFEKPVGFEIWSHEGQTGFHFWAHDDKHADQIRQQINAVYPNAIFRDADQRLVPILPGE